MPDNTIQALRAELDKVRALEADWKARGSPEPEGAGVRAKVAAAEQMLGNALAAPTMLSPDQDPWVNTASDADDIEMPAENMRRPRQQASVVQAHAHKVARERAKRRPPRQTRASREVLNRETDARFWAQTHYRVGQKLDPGNPADKAMVKVWLDIFHKVEAEDAAGHLVTTYDHPEVTALLQEATTARQAAEQHMESAAQAPDTWEQTRNVQAAADANKASQQAASNAAKYQPPTVSPQVAATAVKDAHAAYKKPPPGVVVYPKGHPIHWRPSAQPAHPDLATPNAQSSEPAPPTTASDELALANAAGAPQKAAELHAQDAAKSSGDALPSFPGEGASKPKKGMSKLVKGLLIGAGVLATGGIGYAVYRGTRGSSSRGRRRSRSSASRTMRVAPMPMPMPGRP